MLFRSKGVLARGIPRSCSGVARISPIARPGEAWECTRSLLAPRSTPASSTAPTAEVPRTPGSFPAIATAKRTAATLPQPARGRQSLPRSACCRLTGVALRLAVIVIGLVLVSGAVVGAEHEVYYRYVVLGYVKDDHGKPAASRTVELVRDKTGLPYSGETDQQGLYVIVARLGDESAGETLTLRVGTLSTRVSARFDPANHLDDRGTRVDLEGQRFVERAAWFHPTLARFLGAPER